MTITYEHTHTATTQAKAHGDCSCGEPKSAGCCSLVCSERPNYFCGHLLTDADLSLAQKYVIEKQKLYHRALDGWGVVCGLRLTCDHDCAGFVRVEEGYAIDDCGNDLVVCQTRKVDVLGILREKGYIVAEPPPDPCRPAPPRDNCPQRQCFFITACYEEEPAEFTTPFRASCGSGPATCEPTRIREQVRFDVVAECPPQRNALDSLQQRIEACYAPLTSGGIANKLKERQAVYDAILDKKQTENACQAFCELRVLFLQHLRRCPDRYNCETEAIVRGLVCPEVNSTTFLNEMHDALAELLRQIHEYVSACVANEALVPCPAPTKGCCVVLGTVEVENGSIRRVCNAPRQQLWAPANLVPALMYDIVTGGLRQPRGLTAIQYARYDATWSAGDPAHGAAPAPPAEEHTCCPDYSRDFDPKKFVDGQKISTWYHAYKATAAMTAMRGMSRALYRAFDYTNGDLTSMRIFGDKDNGDIAKLAGLRVRHSEQQAHAAPNLLQVFLRSMLQPSGFPGVIYRDADATEYVASDNLEAANMDLHATDVFRAADSTTHNDDTAAQIAALRRQVGQLQARLDDTSRMFMAAASPPPPPPPPAEASKQPEAPAGVTIQQPPENIPGAKSLRAPRKGKKP